MKILVYIYLLIAGVQIIYGQNEHKDLTYTLNEFDWKIEIPENFKLVNEEKWDESRKKGLNAIEDTFDTEVEDLTTIIFSYRVGRFNNFEAVWQPFDSKIDGNYNEVYSEVNKIIFQTFENKMHGVKLDSITTSQKINGLDFKKFEITMQFQNGMEMKTVAFSKLFGKEEFSINLTYIDEKIGKEMLNALMNSKFQNFRTGNNNGYHK